MAMKAQVIAGATVDQAPPRRGNAATRTTLMDAALAVLDRKCIFDATVEDFVEAAGVARGTFYIYFADKYGVLLALAERMNAEVFHHAYEANNSRLPAFDRLRASLAS